MISQEQIRKKVEKLYAQYLQDWIRGNAPDFPMIIPRVNLSLRGLDFPTQRRFVKELRDGSKEVKKFGYSITWEICNSPKRGKNREPRALYFETLDDLLRFLGKQADFSTTRRVAERIRSRFPQLDCWLRQRKNILKLSRYDGSLEGLLEVTTFFVSNPRPGMYLRQLPLSVSTKFIERNMGTLSEWLDILIPDAVDVSHKKFARRYGLREKAVHVKCRVLDPILFGAINIAYEEFSLPLHHLQTLRLRDVTVFVVENEMNLLTLPSRPRSFAMWGRGDWVVRFGDLRWLHQCDVVYWGDIDVDGFEALTSLRRCFGMRVRSMLMDKRTVEAHHHLASRHERTFLGEPRMLTRSEREAFEWCNNNGRQLEQEKIPQPVVDQWLSTNFSR